MALPIWTEVAQLIVLALLSVSEAREFVQLRRVAFFLGTYQNPARIIKSASAFFVDTFLRYEDLSRIDIRSCCDIFGVGNGDAVHLAKGSNSPVLV
ncbi:MAG: hypothetical protein WD738_10790 [Pirellulales bacterium]